MSTYREQASNTVSGAPDDGTLEVTPASCCAVYFCTIIFFFILCLVSTAFAGIFQVRNACYVELFAHSVSVSNATNAGNVSTADWRTVFIAKSPATGCELSLHTVTSRLLRGDEVISLVSPPLDDLGRRVALEKTDEPVTTVDFKNVVTPVVNGSVVWDYRVESLFGLKAEFANGYLTVVCRDMPVKFTAEAAGNVIGSLLGGNGLCEYSLRDNVNYV